LSLSTYFERGIKVQIRTKTMKILFIGGTGNISSAVSRLAVAKGFDVFHLNRGTRNIIIPGVTTFSGDISNPSKLPDEFYKHNWDVVVNWIAFNPEDIERDIKLFENKTKQYIFISTASVYHKPAIQTIVTESTPLHNPFWDYSMNKIKCEECLMEAYGKNQFPATIVRPSLTYDRVIPIAIGGFNEFTAADRILKGEKIIVHDDGKAFWTVTHSDDFAKGFTGLLGNEKAIGQAFHITSDEILTWNQIYITLAEALGKTAKIVHVPTEFICRINPSYTGTLKGDKASSVIFDNSKIKKFVTDFKASIPFNEGIKRTIAWFNANPDKKIVNENTNKMMDLIIQKYEKEF
jgi:nucleoside-diphosphate-sugar epimerase